MINTLQIVLLGIIGALALASIAFIFMFILEISVEKKTKVKKIKKAKKSNFNQKIESISVDAMLKNIEKETSIQNNDLKNEEQKDEIKQNENSKKFEIQNLNIVNNQVSDEKKVEINFQPNNNDLKSEIDSLKTMVKEEKLDNTQNQINADEEMQKLKSKLNEFLNSKEDIIVLDEDKDDQSSVMLNEDKNDQGSVILNEENVDKKVIETEDEDDFDESNESLNQQDEDNEFEYKVVTFESPSSGEIDYVTRLQKIQASKIKLEKDLTKVEKFILNYERTERRKNRNQRMLDKRASELTNLNLLMYSVTDIKNVDEDKKVKQQELTSHIAELKAGIQDAEEYLDSNREKYNHNKKMSKFLTQENARITDEIVEIKKIIASSGNK